MLQLFNIKKKLATFKEFILVYHARNSSEERAVVEKDRKI